MLILAICDIFLLPFIQNKKNMVIVAMLIIPFYSVSLYRIMNMIFKKIFKREPIDTFLNFKNGLFWDRLFDITFVITTLIFPMLLVAISGEFLDGNQLLFSNNPSVNTNIFHEEQSQNLSSKTPSELTNKIIRKKKLSDNDKLILPIPKD